MQSSNKRPGSTSPGPWDRRAPATQREATDRSTITNKNNYKGSSKRMNLLKSETAEGCSSSCSSSCCLFLSLGSNVQSVSPQETWARVKVHQDMSLPQHQTMFPWLHSYSTCQPPTYPDAIAVIRSVPKTCSGSDYYLVDSGTLKNSMDPADFFISWTDQATFDPLKYNYDPSGSDIRAIIRDLVLEELNHFHWLDPAYHENGPVNDIIELCILYKVLPFLKTDPYAWNKYCVKKPYRAVSNTRVSELHSKSTTTSFQSHNFRRFDLQPSKMIELSSRLIIYCLNQENGHSGDLYGHSGDLYGHSVDLYAHDSTCPSCLKLSSLITLALNFIKQNYMTNEGEHNHSPSGDIYIIKFNDFKEFPLPLIEKPLLLKSSMQKNNTQQLASIYDINTFNDWQNNLLFHERLEMNKMSSMTMVDTEHKLYVGNIVDYQIYNAKITDNTNTTTVHPPYYSPKNSTVLAPHLKYDSANPRNNDELLFNLPRFTEPNKLIIRCSDQSNFPSVDKLWAELDKIYRSGSQVINNIHTNNNTKQTITFNFPCSGSIGLGNLNIHSIETILNTCYFMWNVSQMRHFETFLYCTDGYTETTFLLVAYFIFLWDLSLEDVIYKLHLEKDRPFFLFQVDLQVLGHLQLILRGFSPQRLENSERYRDGYEKLMRDGQGELPARLTIDHETFSSIFLVKVPELKSLIKLNGPLPSRILPHLYLGSLVHAHNPDLLRKLGITHIVSVGENLSWVSANFNNNNNNNDNRVVRGRGVSSPPKVGATRVPGGVGNMRSTVNQSDAEKCVPGEALDLFNIFDQDGFKICKINNLEDNGRDPLTGQGQLNSVLEFIDECERGGGKVLVHCMVGVSRSATVCIAECMKRLRCDLLRAYLYVRVRRLNIIIQPNLMFMYELLKWQETLTGVARTIDWHIMCKAIAELNRKYI